MLFSTLFALTAAASALAVPVSNFTRCDSHISHDDRQMVEAQFAIDHAAVLANETSRRAITPISPSLRRVVHVVWHIIQESTALTGGAITEDTVRQSISTMNTHYSGSTFYFVLDSITRTTNADWFRFAREDRAEGTAMKRALHSGDEKVLNVYSTGVTYPTIGYSTYPWQYSANPYKDGVVINYETVPGGSNIYYNEGKQLTHETGHWLGLYHVFDDGRSSCSDTDFVADTPAQKFSTFGCPTERDTCPDQPGLDSIHNYMDYSYDSCMTEFTPGQIERMKAQTLTYRGIRGQTWPPIILTHIMDLPSTVASAPIPVITGVPIPAPGPHP